MKQFLTDLSSKKPAPGGGSAAAMSGAMAAALVKKVAQLTIGKEKYANVENEFLKIEKEAEELRKRLMELVEEDTQAFMEVIKTKNSQEAIKKAAEVPLETAKNSLKVLKIATYSSSKGNQNLRSDAFCAIELATAAIYGALENVRINLTLIKDKKFVEELKDEMEKILNGTDGFVKP